LAEGSHWRTISGIIARYVECGTVGYSAIPGCPAKIATPKVIKKVKDLLTKQPDKSICGGSQKLRISKSTFHQIKARKLGFKTYKKVTIPKYSGNQEARAKSACLKIYRKMLLSNPDTILVMDHSCHET
jgi:hypothetical protein